MTSLNALGLKIAALTLGVFSIVFGAYWGIRTTFFGVATPAEVGQNTTNTYTPLPDADGDGIPDRYEEVESTATGSSNDVELPTGKNALPEGQVAGAQTYTQQYLATLPTGTAREDVLDKTKLETFVDANRGELMPTLAEGTVKTTPEAGKEAISTYLDTISATQNKQLHQVTNDDIEKALTQQLQLNREPLNTIVTQLEQNIQVLKSIPAPAEVADMHEKLIRATTALHTNVLALRDIDQDFVGGLIATRNIDDIGKVFAEIANSIKELETKYGLE